MQEYYIFMRTPSFFIIIKGKKNKELNGLSSTKFRLMRGPCNHQDTDVVDKTVNKASNKITIRSIGAELQLNCISDSTIVTIVNYSYVGIPNHSSQRLPKTLRFT